MDAGLSVPLDPLGGNQLNVRELLRLLQPAPVAVPDDADDAGMEEGLPAGSAPEREPEPVGRRTILDDYDYDDDFIDDAELVEEEEHDGPEFGEEYDESADEDFKPDEREGSESEEQDQSQAREPGPPPEPKPAAPSPAHHGFGQFFVNKGNIPSKVKLKPANPPSKLGNVSLKHIKFPAALNQLTTSKPGPGRSSSGEEGAKQGSTNAAKKPSTGANDTPQPAKRKSSEGPSSTSKAKPLLAEAVMKEITKLAKICDEEFSGKKPKLNDAKVQDQLHVIFKVAMEAGFARLFSDIAKDKRIISLSDEVWVPLSRFLRTKRSNLEQLGHALHWSARETNAKSRVSKTEVVVDALMKKQLEAALVKPDDPNGGKMVEWTTELDEKLYDWYRSRCDLQNAKNQLASRVKSIKKCLPTWVSNLRAKSFSGFAAADQEIIDSFRRIEEERQAEERKKRDAERMERKRKKEEQAAAVAAKRAATAQAKAAAVAAAAAAAANARTANAKAASGAPSEASPPGSAQKPMKTAKNTAKAVIARPGMGKAVSSKPGVAKPGMAKPVVTKPGVAKSVVAKPGVAKPGAVKPGAAKPSVVKPGSGKPVIAKAVNMKPGGVKPGIVKPGVTKAHTKPGGAKSTATKVTPTKVAGAKMVKHVTTSPGAGAAGGHKQVKLTSMIKKTGKTDSSGPQTGKLPSNSSGAGVSKKGLTGKVGKASGVVKAGGTKSTPTKVVSSKAIGPKNGNAKPGMGKSGGPKSTPGKSTPGKMSGGRVGSNKVTPNKMEPGKAGNMKVGPPKLTPKASGSKTGTVAPGGGATSAANKTAPQVCAPKVGGEDRRRAAAVVPTASTVRAACTGAPPVTSIASLVGPIAEEVGPRIGFSRPRDVISLPSAGDGPGGPGGVPRQAAIRTQASGTGAPRGEPVASTAAARIGVAALAAGAGDGDGESAEGGRGGRGREDF